MEYFGFACWLVPVAVVALLVFARWWANRRFYRISLGGPREAVCITCQGRGWIEHHQRTLDFTGDGFADVHRPSTMCQVCGGTGRVRR